MKRRTLGRVAPLEVGGVGLGCMSMTPLYGTPDPAIATATIHRALDIGGVLIDTADMYGTGANETFVGRALAGQRERAVLATKFGNVRLADGTRTICGRPDYVIEACEKSLTRLGVEVIDLYYQHRVDPETPIEETVGAMARLVEQGKVRRLGLSEAGPETIRRAHATHPITALQSEYSLFTRDVEPEILPTCRELGIGFVAYAPLGRGVLSGTIGGIDDLPEADRRREHPRYDAENLANNVSLLGPLKALAQAKGATPAQIAIAWVLSRGDDIAPIPGTTKPERFEENLAALELDVHKDELDGLAAAIDAGRVAGTRYPAGGMKRVGI